MPNKQAAIYWSNIFVQENSLYLWLFQTIKIIFEKRVLNVVHPEFKCPLVDDITHLKWCSQILQFFKNQHDKQQKPYTKAYTSRSLFP